MILVKDTEKYYYDLEVKDVSTSVDDTDVVKAKETCSATLQSLNEKAYADIKASQYFWLERTPESTVEETLAKVERHFGLAGSDAHTDAISEQTVCR